MLKSNYTKCLPKKRERERRQIIVGTKPANGNNHANVPISTNEITLSYQGLLNITLQSIHSNRHRIC